MNDFYQEFLTFRNNYNFSIDQEIINAKKNGYYCTNDYGEIYLLEKYLDKKYDSDIDYNRYYDLQFRFLTAFPKEFVLPLIEKNFQNRSICYKTLVHIEIVKYLYTNWNNDDSDIQYWCDTIKKHLTETANLDPAVYNDIIHNPKNPKYDSEKNYIYYTWWLYVYYPLLENDDLILKLIDFVYLNDAQDMLLYGIYQMDEERLNGFFPQFLLRIDQRLNQSKPCFYPWCKATGAYSQMVRILKKLYKAGYNLFIDPTLKEIFEAVTDLQEKIEK